MFLLMQWQLDILISAIAMPGEDGYSLMRQLRVIEKYQQRKPLAAIAITSFIAQEKCIKGIDGFALMGFLCTQKNHLTSIHYWHLLIISLNKNGTTKLILNV
ncbi:hypothetical protein NIES2101_37250 [Calothrix sp. HK-06]|nr:hypothetical protein NIES2101_37250 [Calothrix sp. HK-06]